MTDIAEDDLAWVGASFLGAMCPDLCNHWTVKAEVTARIKSIRLTLVDHWDTFESYQKQEEYEDGVREVVAKRRAEV
jgi:hypothetical protein